MTHSPRFYVAGDFTYSSVLCEDCLQSAIIRDGFAHGLHAEPSDIRQADESDQTFADAWNISAVYGWDLGEWADGATCEDCGTEVYERQHWSDDQLSSAFYSTTLDRKLTTLRAVEGKTIDSLDSLANAICDGVGGCEQLAYGWQHGEQTMVSVLWSGRTTYYVKVDAMVRQGLTTVTDVAIHTRLVNESEDSLSLYGRIVADGDWQPIGEFLDA